MGFKDVVIIADEGTGPGDRTLENMANRLAADWQPSGVHVHYVTAHEPRPGQGMTSIMSMFMTVARTPTRSRHAAAAEAAPAFERRVRGLPAQASNAPTTSVMNETGLTVVKWGMSSTTRR